MRHRQTVNSITKAADGLQDLLAELSNDSFVQTITKSDRRDRTDTLKKLKGLAEKLGEIRKQLHAAKKAANVAAKKSGELYRREVVGGYCEGWLWLLAHAVLKVALSCGAGRIRRSPICFFRSLVECPFIEFLNHVGVFCK